MPSVMMYGLSYSTVRWYALGVGDCHIVTQYYTISHCHTLLTLSPSLTPPTLTLSPPPPTHTHTVTHPIILLHCHTVPPSPLSNCHMLILSHCHTVIHDTWFVHCQVGFRTAGSSTSPGELVSLACPSRWPAWPAVRLRTDVYCPWGEAYAWPSSQACYMLAVFTVSLECHLS